MIEQSTLDTLDEAVDHLTEIVTMLNQAKDRFEHSDVNIANLMLINAIGNTTAIKDLAVMIKQQAVMLNSHGEVLEGIVRILRLQGVVV